MSKSSSSSPQNSVKVINGVLILSFPEADMPVVWRMELSKIALSAFEVRKKGEKEKGFTLHLKTAGEKDQTIATFKTKEDAVSALLSVTQAMEPLQETNQADKEEGLVQQGSLKKSSTGKSRFLVACLALLFVVALLFLLSNVGPSQKRFPSEDNGVSSTNAIGTPLSADDFLRTRQ